MLRPGAPTLMVGVLSGVYPVMQFLAAPVLGRLSDRFGRKPVLLVSQLGTFIGFVLMGFASDMLPLLVARSPDRWYLWGEYFNCPGCAHRQHHRERLAPRRSAIAAFGLGFTIGPVLAYISLALSGNNYHVTAFVAAGCSLLSILPRHSGYRNRCHR